MERLYTRQRGASVADNYSLSDCPDQGRARTPALFTIPRRGKICRKGCPFGPLFNHFRWIWAVPKRLPVSDGLVHYNCGTEISRRANVHPITLGPHGSNFTDVTKALQPFTVPMATLQRRHQTCEQLYRMIPPPIRTP
jgi:hypothetical protein